MRNEFRTESKRLLLLSRLLPRNMMKTDTMPDFTSVLQLYRTDLPPSDFNAEYAAWKTFITVNQEFKDADVVKTLNTLNSDTYPAIYTFLRILSVIPVSTATGNSTN